MKSLFFFSIACRGQIRDSPNVLMWTGISQDPGHRWSEAIGCTCDVLPQPAAISQLGGGGVCVCVCRLWVGRNSPLLFHLLGRFRGAFKFKLRLTFRNSEICWRLQGRGHKWRCEVGRSTWREQKGPRRVDSAHNTGVEPVLSACKTHHFSITTSRVTELSNLLTASSSHNCNAVDFFFFFTFLLRLH